jgi:hypothetical protein
MHRMVVALLPLLAACAAYSPAPLPVPAPSQEPPPGALAVEASTQSFRVHVGGTGLNDEDAREAIGTMGRFGLGYKATWGHLGVTTSLDFDYGSEEEDLNWSFGGLTIYDAELSALIMPLKVTFTLESNPGGGARRVPNFYGGAGVGLYPYAVDVEFDTNMGDVSDDESGVEFGVHFVAGVEWFVVRRLGFYSEVSASAVTDADLWGVDLGLGGVSWVVGLAFAF